MTLGGRGGGGQSTFALVDGLKLSNWMFPDSPINCATLPPPQHTLLGTGTNTPTIAYILERNGISLHLYPYVLVTP